jgi:hypothetical protein
LQLSVGRLQQSVGPFQFLSAFLNPLFEFGNELIILLQELFVAAFQGDDTGGIPNRLQQFLRLPGLEKIAEHLTAVDGAENILQLGIATDQNPHGFGKVSSGPVEQFQSGSPWHFEIADEYIHFPLAENLLRFIRTSGSQDFKLPAQHSANGG